MSPTAFRLLTLPRRANRTATMLQLVASAVTTVLAFGVLTLARVYWMVPGIDGYRVLAVALVVLLAVPLVTLGTAAGRLSARSRDERLATLRLLGLRTRAVRAIAVTETTIIAGTGILGGAALALGLPFAVGALSVAGRSIAAESLWLPAWIWAALPAVLVLVAAGSALLGLRRVVLTPLGVRARTDAPKLRWIRLLLAGAGIAGAVVLLQFTSPGWGTTGIVLAIASAVLVVMGVLGIAGPFVVAVIARIRVRATADPASLIAARANLEDPKAAWRQVSGVALTSFLLLPAGSMLGFLDAVQRTSTVLTPGQILLFHDARTILIALVLVAFLLVTCQIGITQAAAVLERRDLYIALDRIGMPRRTMHAARMRQVTAPALIAVVGSAAASVLLASALLVVALTNAPLFFLAAVLALIAGIVLVRAGVHATTPILRRTLQSTAREE